MFQLSTLIVLLLRLKFLALCMAEFISRQGIRLYNFIISTLRKTRTVVRVRVRRAVIRIRIRKTAIRIRVVVRTENTTPIKLSTFRVQSYTKSIRIDSLTREKGEAALRWSLPLSLFSLSLTTLRLRFRP